MSYPPQRPDPHQPQRPPRSADQAVPAAVTPMVVYRHPISPPPGYAVLAIEVDREPYIFPAALVNRFQISGSAVAIAGKGTWYVAVVPGKHDVRCTDYLGIPLMTTVVVADPGFTHHLSFRFGTWRNRIHDRHGTDVTKFGLWSHLSIELVLMGVFGTLCCVTVGLPKLL